MAMRAFFGIIPVLLDETTVLFQILLNPLKISTIIYYLFDKGKQLEKTNSQGVLCIQKPWPGMARTIYGDHERFLNTYMRPYPGMLQLFLRLLND